MLDGLFYGLMMLASLFLHCIVSSLLLYLVDIIPANRKGLRTLTTFFGILVLSIGVLKFLGS